tara:strand:- start:488 stop:745 length:258 start_codon:yes stop_codon:yes gene_type:complete
MKEITNSLTKVLDEKLLTDNELDDFIDGLEDEVLGLPTRDFYLKYKGDIKELLQGSHNIEIDLSIESELLGALMVYCSQRKRLEE